MDKITLELSVEQVNVVLAALAKLPIEVGLGTFNTVQSQAASQVNQAPQELPADSVE